MLERKQCKGKSFLGGRCVRPVAYGRPNRERTIVTENKEFGYTAGVFHPCEPDESGLCYYHKKKARGLFDTTPEMHRRRHKGDMQIGFKGKGPRILNFL